ncbi:translation initiation factor 1 [Parelusimicrobium proximum]|uniref:stress response translation initiation inhibitor YciH n=1 Tax=Parelusimicrobium proximum TaxID=3228953 RepID=UPI003D1648B6
MSGKILYSTDASFCAHCQSTPCQCKNVFTPYPQKEPVRVSYARNAKGSGVTIIDRLNMHPQGKEDMLKFFKKSLGCGGSVKEGKIELQGDKKERVEAELIKKGYKVRRINW